MNQPPYPEMITSWPEADIPFPGIRGWLSQAADHQIVFFDIKPVGVVPPHSHGAQWGVVLEGEMELTIGGDTHKYRSGDTYYIPDGVEHSAMFLSQVRVIDVFADRDRYKTKAT